MHKTLVGIKTDLGGVMTDYQSIVTRLLHTEEEGSNKLIDLNAREGARFLIRKADYAGELCELMFDVCRERIGKPATTVLTASALVPGAKTAVPGANEFAYEEADGTVDAKRLDRFYKDASMLTTAKGDNPVFLSLGAVKWNIPVDDGQREILSPLLLIPVRLVRSGGATQPITVEFADDDIFFNPSFYEKLKKTANERFIERFPLPTRDLKTPIDPDAFDPGAYFAKLNEYFAATAGEGETPAYELIKNDVSISMYNNPDMAAYRDIERNKERILSHPVVKAMFFGEEIADLKTEQPIEPLLVLPYDGRQERLIRRILNGENLIIKGPPGTGKTQTIANLTAALLAAGKRVLFSSRKISALSEVYNKLPAEIKPFLLRLDYESEAESAKIDARVVHDLLKEARNFRSKESESAVLTKRADAFERKYGAIARLKSYKEKMFGSSGDNFYRTLTGYMKHAEFAPVPFELPGKALQTSNEDFYAALETVKRVAASYQKLTDCERIPLRLNPWYSIKPEYAIREETIARAEALKTEAKAILNRLAEAEARNKEIASVVKNFRLDVVNTIAQCPFRPEDAIGILMQNDLPAFAERLKRFSLELRFGRERIENAIKKGTNIFEIDLAPGKPLNGLKTASNLDLRLLKKVAETPEIYNDRNGVLSEESDLSVLLNALRMYATSLSEAKNTAKSAAAVFKESVFTDRSENDAVTESFDKLKRYVGSGGIAPKALDFAGKRALKSAKSRMHNPDYVDFPSVLSALQRVQNYNRYANQAAKFMEKARNQLHYKLESEQATDLLKLLEAFYTEGKSGFQTAVRCIEQELPAIENARDAAGIPEDSTLTLGDLKELYLAAAIRKKLEKEFNALKAKLHSLEDGCEPEYYELIGAAVEALDYLSEAEKAEYDAGDRTEAERAEAVVRFGMTVKSIAEKSEFPDFLNRFTAFYREAFTDNAFANPAEIRLRDLQEFKTYIGDRSHLAAAANYRVMLANEKRLNVTAFFRPFAQGQRRLKENETFQDLFEHSFYAIRIDAVKAALGEGMYKLTRDHLEADLKTLKEAEADLFRLNATRTAQLAASRFDPEAKEFDFLKTNTSYTSCRRLFLEKSVEIVKLKQAFILSPPSVSLLLRSEDYWNFDVAIVDEASQLPPEYIIGIAARAKQCVIVGDENQMPPIKHFVRSEEPTEDDGLIAVESAIELLKQCGTFPVDELNAHYRSMTETLIRYSQRKYYPEMATFPTVVPRGESLGLFDRFVDGAHSAEGENEKEAVETVAAVERQFERFFDQEKKRLKRSVGVVTFGRKQRELVLKKISENRALHEKIRDAEAAAEAAEKAFFVRTIETVQGQETDDLILSVTYGRDKNGGKNENFGQLNGKLGERIFNVAVTRAKYSVTLIHSIRANEITTEGLGYLKEYMEEVERFDADDAAKQFVSGGEPDAFRRSAAEALIAAGVDRQAIVFDYGVTENSIKIPIAVLSEDRTRALFGLWPEGEPTPDYFDGAVRYPEILRSRGWILYEIFAFDWVRNYEAERKNLIEFAKKQIAAAKA